MRSLRTPRLDLTPLEPADAPALSAVLADPELYRHLPHGPPADATFLEQRFRRLAVRRSPDGSQQWLNWVVRARGRRDAVGLVEVSVEGTQAHLAYFVARTRWRRGIAREACAAVLEHLREDLGVTQAITEMDMRNTRRPARSSRRCGLSARRCTATPTSSTASRATSTSTASTSPARTPRRTPPSLRRSQHRTELKPGGNISPGNAIELVTAAVAT
jgi:RimJ/RimL family protein N-acetyltransferase